MNIVVSGTEMKKVDKYTIEQIGVPSVVLMERAAKSVADVICQNETKDKSILVVASVGNNGADGIAIGRMLYLQGYNTCICILGDIGKSTEEFKIQLNITRNLGIKVVAGFEKADVIVDAIFGIGLTRNVEGIYAETINKINNSDATVYAVDIPSGIDGDNGKVCGIAVKADYTVTFGAYKNGTVLYPGADYCGQVIVASIGFPQVAYDECREVINSVTEEELKYIPARPNYSNKGTFGKVLVIAGSKDITGAAYLCGEGAFRVGAGLVRIFTPVENREVLQKLLPEAMVNCYDVDQFDKKMLDACLNWCDVVAIGPGLSTGVLQKIIVDAVLESKLPTVIDADGINNIAEDEKLKKKLHKNVIITPHVGEMARLLGMKIDEVADDVVKHAKLANYKFNVNCVLKDARTIIATDKNTYINLTGNNGMATAGSGDVLTGIITGLLAIGVDLEKASVLGPYLHGVAGDMATQTVSQTSMMATDILNEIKNIFK